MRMAKKIRWVPQLSKNFTQQTAYIWQKSNSHYSWLVVSTYPSEKYEFASWDDDIPNRWKNRIHVPNHQPESIEPEKTINHVLTNGY